MYRLYSLASRIIPRIPRRLVLSLAPAIAFCAWLLARGARRQAMKNMQRVLCTPDTRAGRSRLRRVVYGMFLTNVRNYLDMFSLSSTKPEDILRSIRRIDGIEHLEAALALGKGAILFSAHYGPFNFIVHWLSLKGYQVIIPVEHLQDERVLALILKLRRSQGIQFVPLGGSAPLRTILAALRKNQIVLITADRAVQGESVTRDFFGSPARLPDGPVSLALRTGAPLVGAFSWRLSATSMMGTFAPLSLALPEEERRQPDKLMSRVASMLEVFIRAHPDQWVVFSPLWLEDQKQRDEAIIQAGQRGSSSPRSQ